MRDGMTASYERQELPLAGEGSSESSAADWAWRRWPPDHRRSRSSDRVCYNCR